MFCDAQNSSLALVLEPAVGLKISLALNFCESLGGGFVEVDKKINRERKKRGRQTLSADDKKSCPVTVWFTPKERADIVAIAKDCVVPVSRWLHMLATKAPVKLPVSKLERAQYGNITRLGNNLNQLARNAHFERVQVDIGLLNEAIAEVRKLQARMSGECGEDEITDEAVEA